MSSMPDVLCNAGPLITLGKLNRLEVLSELYGEVRIPRSVYDEVVTSGLAKGASDANDCTFVLAAPEMANSRCATSRFGLI